MNNVRHLNVVKPVAPEVREDTVKLIREILKEAKKGEVTEVVILTRGPNGWRESASSTNDFLGWIGRLRVQESEWIDRYRELTNFEPSDPEFEADDE